MLLAGVIAQVNLVRAARGRPLDVGYAGQLSADALPAWHRGLPLPGTHEACEAAERLNRRWQGERDRRERWDIALARRRAGRSDVGYEDGGLRLSGPAVGVIRRCLFRGRVIGRRFIHRRVIRRQHPPPSAD